MFVQTSAPAKLIISGEHSVLNGYHAIAIAVNKRINVKITYNDNKNDNKISIKSNVFGNHTSTLDTNYKLENKWYDIILFIANKLAKQGLSVEITSNIDDIGIGSSGALFACVASGIMMLNNKCNYSKYELAMEILSLYKDFYKQQKTAEYHSGIDIITSIFGGVICFSPKTNDIIPLPNNIFKKFNGITAIYTGHKTITEDACKIANSNGNKDIIYEKIGKITNKIYDNIVSANIEGFLKNIQKNQEYLEKLGLCDAETNEILDMCQQHNNVAKISGSGLGDCIIVFDKIKTDKYRTLDVIIDNHGLTISNIKK